MNSRALPIFTQEEGDRLIRRVRGCGIGAKQHIELAESFFTHDLVAEIKRLDPFSPNYKLRVMDLYQVIRGRVGYSPEVDELSHLPALRNVHADCTPWSFRSIPMISEFLFSWGQICHYLSLEPGQSVLEYGPGSGQILLLLARSGVEAYGVDIDGASLELIRRQANDMGVNIHLERASFGHGFEAPEFLQFDRVVFFEAFHHAIEFQELLLTLHSRLKPGGRIIFCGEPIVRTGFPGIPYPWGPRLDALSLYCMRSMGWMELGYQHDTFVELLYRTGWKVTHDRTSPYNRAHIYVAQPIWEGIKIGEPLELGRFSEGWWSGEGSHRWTTHDAHISLPVDCSPRIDVEIELSNYSPIVKDVTLSSGAARQSFALGSGESNRRIRIQGCTDRTLRLESNIHVPGAHDNRSLGVAVNSVLLLRS